MTTATTTIPHDYHPSEWDLADQTISVVCYRRQQRICIVFTLSTRVAADAATVVSILRDLHTAHGARLFYVMKDARRRRRRSFGTESADFKSERLLLQGITFSWAYLIATAELGLMIKPPFSHSSYGPSKQTNKQMNNLTAQRIGKSDWCIR